MEWLDNRNVLEFLVDLIGYASIVSAAIFGMIGLFADYKVEGRTTVWGKVAAVGIVLSAVFGLTSAVLSQRAETAQRNQDRIEAEKERERAEAQYAGQIAQLLGINRRITGVNQTSSTLLGRMGESLAAQERTLAAQEVLLGSARQSMLMTSGLTLQERENTLRVLRSVWDEANRITGSRFEVLLKAQCDTGAETIAPPLFANATLFVTLLDERQAEEHDSGAELTGSAALELLGTSLFSFQQDNSLSTSGAPVGLSRFHSFMALFPDEVASPDVWRSGYFKTVVTTVAPASFPGREALLEEAARRTGDASAKAGELGELPCEAVATVFANGRMLGETSGPVQLIKERDGTLLLGVETPAVSVEEGALPVFVAR